MPYVMRGWSVTQQRLGIIAFHKLFGLKYLCYCLTTLRYGATLLVLLVNDE